MRLLVSYQVERLHRGERKERPSDPRTGQETEPLGGQGKMCHHVAAPQSTFILIHMYATEK